MEDTMNRTLYLYGEINNESVLQLTKQIHEINYFDEIQLEYIKDYKPENIILHINTCGGSLTDGFSLISSIESSITPIVGIVSGLCASMGLAIYASCHYRISSIYARFMYHSVGYGISGKLYDHITELKESRVLQEMYDNILLSVTNLEKEDLTSIQESKTNYWFGAYKSLEIGLTEDFFEISAEGVNELIEKDANEKDTNVKDTNVKDNKSKTKNNVSKIKRIFKKDKQ